MQITTVSSGIASQELPPAIVKRLLLSAQLTNDLLQEVEKTTVAFKEFVEQSRETLARQTDENKFLQERIAALEEEKKQVSMTLQARVAALEEEKEKVAVRMSAMLRASGMDTRKFVTDRLIALEKLAWGQFAEKIAIANEILAFEPNQPRALLKRGHAYYQRDQDYERAEADFAKAYAVDKKNFWITYYVGLTAMRLGDRNKAVEFVEKATTLNPGSADNQDSLAVSLFALNCFAKAIEQASAAIRLDASRAKECPGIIAASRLCQQLGALPNKDYDAKIAKATEILALKPDQSYALFMRAHSYYYKKQFDLAWEDINKAYQIAPKDYWNVIYMGFTAWERGERALGIEFVEKATQISPNRYEPYWNLAKFYFAQGDMIQSRQAAVRSLELKPDDRFCQDLLHKIDRSYV